jgi:CPA2 family monovalent cation:H+ antiporter-2
MRGFRFAVIDEDPVTFRELSGAGIPVILGNPEVPLILKQAGIDRAWVLAVALLDPGQVESVAATARQLNPRIDIIARGLTEDSPERLRRIGVGRVVQSEFEVGAQFVRHTLQRFGMTSQEVQALLLRLRRERLGEE